MAPFLDQDSVSNALIVIGIVAISVIVLFILLFLLTAIYIYLRGVWCYMIRNPHGYREWNRLRKEWNKAARSERRSRHLMALYLGNEVRKQELSQEDGFRYGALVGGPYTFSYCVLISRF